MKKNFFEKFIEKENRLFKRLEKVDEVQREKGDYNYRYITMGFADRTAYYQIIEETPRKYILGWVLGESPYPDWGSVVKLPKKEVQKMIDGRDHFADMIKERKKGNA